jgi:4-amino-4-deoxy-L-arabinose transferase-like glycosyltransferase
MLSTRTLQAFLHILVLIAIAFIPGVGLAFGAPDEIFPALMALLVCAVFLWLFLRSRNLPVEDRKWLLYLSFIALFIRVLVAFAIFYGPIDRDLFGEDQGGYDHMPFFLVRYWQGISPKPTFLFEGRSADRIGYYLFLALQYDIFGPSLLVPRMFNCLAGALTIVYAYRLGFHVFGRMEGRVTALWTTFFPSLVLWSTLNLRDIWLTLSILIIVWHTLLLRERLSMASLVTLLGVMIWLQYVRPYLLVVMAVTVLSVFLLSYSKNLGRGLFLGIGFSVLLFFLYYQFDIGKHALELMDLERIEKFRRGIASIYSGKSGYYGEVDLSNPLELLIFLPIGLIYFLFSPFPWEIRGFRQVITLPEMLTWYLTIPFIWRIMNQALKRGARKNLALLLPLIIISFVYAVGSANIGLAYRYRSQIIILYLVFTAAGYVQWRLRRYKRRQYPIKFAVPLKRPV